MNESLIKNKSDRFWQWFSDNEKAMGAIGGNDDQVLDVALDELHLVDEALYLEVATDDNPKELVVTAHGKSELFPLVDLVVASAPPVPDWKFIALKPAMGFDFETEFRGCLYDAHELWFLPLVKPSKPWLLGLRCGLVETPLQEKDDICDAVSVILETGLGERAFATGIMHIEVALLPQEPAKRGYMEFSDLPRYLEWHKKQSK